MRLCNDTITVFNSQLNTALDRDVYTGTVIIGVSWFREVASAVDNSGLKAADATSRNHDTPMITVPV